MSTPQTSARAAQQALDSPDGSTGIRGWAARRPLTAFLLLVFGVGWPLMSVPALSAHGVLPGGDLPAEVWILATVFLVMLPAAMWVTWASEGRRGVQSMLRRSFRWRFGAGWWALVLLALPLVTLGVGLITGRSLQASNVVSLLASEILALVIAVVVINLWEETVWAGFLQTRLERRHGLAGAAGLTSIAFAGIHVPLGFVGDFSATSVAVGFAVLLAVSVLIRLLVGVMLRAAADSLLAVGVLHAVWNTSNNEGGVADSLLSGGQPTVPAVIAAALLTGAVAIAVRPRLTRDFRRGAER